MEICVVNLGCPYPWPQIVPGQKMRLIRASRKPHFLTEVTQNSPSVHSWQRFFGLPHDKCTLVPQGR